MRLKWTSEDIASEPSIARGDDANGRSCFRERKLKRNFVFEKLVALHEEMIL